MGDFDIKQGLIILSLFIIAGSIHEFAHAFSAYVLGDPTAKNEGRMTLNPLAHIDPVGTILFPIIVHLGWMKPVPVFLGNLRHPLRDDAIISFAGPFSNFLQACAAIFILRFFPIENGTVQMILATFAQLNLWLMGFNLLPFPPLDGGAILRYFLPPSMHEGFDQFSRYSFILLIIFFLTGLLSLLLIPFSMLLEFFLDVNLFVLFLINLFNFGITGYFLREEISQIWNKTTWAAKKMESKGKEMKVTAGNKKPIQFAKEIIPIVELGETLNEEQLQQVKEIKKNLSSGANICPPEDYDLEDQTCQKCEWFNNCLIRKIE